MVLVRVLPRSHAPDHDLCLDAVPRMMVGDQHGPDYDDGHRGFGLDGGQRRPICFGTLEEMIDRW